MAPELRAVFLDRDGTVVREAGYVTEPSALRVLPGAGRAIQALRRGGFLVLLATNQSAVARGLISEARLGEIHVALGRRLARLGTALDGIYVCPHHPSIGRMPYRRRCRCRKPAAGMLLRAARERSIDLGRSYLVGDGARDVAAALRAGVTPILVRSGHGARDEARARALAPDLQVVADLAAAARVILGGGRSR